MFILKNTSMFHLLLNIGTIEIVRLVHSVVYIFVVQYHMNLPPVNGPSFSHLSIHVSPYAMILSRYSLPPSWYGSRNVQKRQAMYEITEHLMFNNLCTTKWVPKNFKNTPMHETKYMEFALMFLRRYDSDGNEDLNIFKDLYD